jgi:hypothetical protein
MSELAATKIGGYFIDQKNKNILSRNRKKMA